MLSDSGSRFNSSSSSSSSSGCRCCYSSSNSSGISGSCSYNDILEAVKAIKEKMAADSQPPQVAIIRS